MQPPRSSNSSVSSHRLSSHRLSSGGLRTEAVIIGGGQAGLAMSHCLAQQGIEHVVLEGGRVAERWRGHWDSLRLLTPNWQTRLPSYRYRGGDPEGFMTRDQVVSFLERYARFSAAPVLESTTVTSVRQTAAQRFIVDTDRGCWSCDSVIIATGECGKPFVPRMATYLSPKIRQLTMASYKNPAQLDSPGVLVVGASASGLQVASELQRHGHAVTLAVGRHTRLPRRYRGRDILDWFDAMGILSERGSDVRNLRASRRSPSMQLVGSADGRSLDLGSLQQLGTRLVGRAAGIDGTRVAFLPDLSDSISKADDKLNRLLDRVDSFAMTQGLDAPCFEARPAAIERVTAVTEIDLWRDGIRTVVWATGYTQSYPWLHLPVLDARGQLLHHEGLTPVAGLYTLGLRFLRRRNSNFIDGVGNDARELSELIADRRQRAPRNAA